MSYASEQWIEAMSQARFKALEDAAKIAEGCGTRWGNNSDEAFNEGCRFAAAAIRLVLRTPA